jgi:lipopolysaccharide export system permease protein
MLARAEALETAYIQTGGGPLALNGGQLWLRQSDHELFPKGVAIIHANSVALRDERLTTGPVSVFRLDDSDHLLARVEATNGVLAANGIGSSTTRAPSGRTSCPIRPGKCGCRRI